MSVLLIIHRAYLKIGGFQQQRIKANAYKYLMKLMPI
jgi:hypothetical protein